MKLIQITLSDDNDNNCFGFSENGWAVCVVSGVDVNNDSIVNFIMEQYQAKYSNE